MLFESINIAAVLAATLASMVIGSLWYGPLFGNTFMKAMGMDTLTKEQQQAMMKGMWKTYLGQFLASVLMFTVFAAGLAALNQLTLTGGLLVSFLVWLGIIVPVKYSEQIWGGKMILFWLGAGNMLVTMLAAGAIIGAWH